MNPAPPKAPSEPRDYGVPIPTWSTHARALGNPSATRKPTEVVIIHVGATKKVLAVLALVAGMTF